MSELDAVFGTLKTAQEPDSEDALVIELVFAQPRREAELFNQIRRRLSAARIELKEAFSAAGEPDRYFFLTLPDASPSGREAEVFEFARRLAASLSALEANPCLQEGLTYGNELDAAKLETLARDVFRTASPGLLKGWAPNAIEADKAWTTTRGQGVKVAQIDTGHSTHTELQDIYELNDQLNLIETNTPRDASDRFSRDVFFPHPGHGTYGASVMTSRGGLVGDQASEPGQITGVAPDCRIVPIRAIRSVIDLNQKRIPAAIRHAIKAGCDVITMCLGGITHSASVQKAMREAVEEGLIIVCAAGNVWPWVVFPAAYSADRLCVAVAAVDQDLRPWEWTARGPAVTVSAPGKNVWAARKNNQTDSDAGVALCNGTTLACSLTSGVAALFLAKHGGRLKLRDIARTAGLTVQELFLRAVVYNLTPPPIWRGAGGLGAGVVDAQTVLEFDVTKARLAPVLAKAEVSPRDFVPAIEILGRLAGAKDPLAEKEADAAIEPYAQELIWRFFIKDARERMGKIGPISSAEKLARPALKETAPNEDLAKLLSERAHLARVMGY